MKYLLLAVTALPLVQGVAVRAETKISTAITSPVATSTAANGARDDLTIEKAGSLKPAAAGVAITIDSANKVRNDGEIAFDDKNASTGVRLATDGPAGFENLGTLRLAEDFTGKDDDGDGVPTRDENDEEIDAKGDRVGGECAGRLTRDI